MDKYGHVNNVIYAQYLEEARVDLFDHLRWDMLTEGVVVARLEITYKTPLEHNSAPVPVDVWVSRVAAAAFDLGYEIHDGAGTVYATATTTLVPYDFSAGRPRRLTPAEKQHLERLAEAA